MLTVEFTVAGIPCIGLNGGPAFKHSEAFSFQIATDDQQETDRYWNAIVGNGGQESACGWCKDNGASRWQITPRVLTEALAAGGDEAKRAFDAMMAMKKIDVAAIRRRGAADGRDLDLSAERRGGLWLMVPPTAVGFTRLHPEPPAQRASRRTRRRLCKAVRRPLVVQTAAWRPPHDEGRRGAAIPNRRRALWKDRMASGFEVAVIGGGAAGIGAARRSARPASRR